MQPEDNRRQQEKLREVALVADRLGCSVIQLSIAWCLKNDSVQCLLLGASSVDQLYQAIHSLQVYINFISIILLNIYIYIEYIKLLYEV